MDFKKWIGLVLVVLVVAFLIKAKFLNSGISSSNLPSPTSQSSQPQVVSTDPANLDGATIVPNQVIKITFDTPLRQASEVNSKIDPKIDYTVSLSDDKKSIIFTPAKPLPLKSGYTLYIYGSTRFNATTTLGRDLMYKFMTIDYSGV